jgi:hypothetical protein
MLALSLKIRGSIPDQLIEDFFPGSRLGPKFLTSKLRLINFFNSKLDETSQKDTLDLDHLKSHSGFFTFHSFCCPL